MFKRVFAVLLLLPVAGVGQNFVLGTKLELNTLDPHFFAAFPTISPHEHLFDKLVVYDDAMMVAPAKP